MASPGSDSTRSDGGKPNLTTPTTNQGDGSSTSRWEDASDRNPSSLVIPDWVQKAGEAIESASTSTEDGLKTPTSRNPSSLNPLTAPPLSGSTSPASGPSQLPTPALSSTGEGSNYFNTTKDATQPTVQATVDHPSPLSDRPYASKVAPHLLKEYPLEDAAAVSSSGSSGPTSVPLAQGPDPSRLNQGQEKESSFNQSHTQRIRTRTSSPRQTRYYPTSNTSSTSDLGNLHAGAKTVGNTPTQSPYLLSPTFAAKKPGTDSDDGHYTTPLLNPTHMKEPKEYVSGKESLELNANSSRTHKLMKDVDPHTGRKLVNNYELYRKLGSGQHGTVKLGRNLDNGDQVAVKIVRRYSKKVRLGRSGDPNDMIKKEVAILKKARHPHIVSLFEVIDDEEYNKVYLILEFVEKGEIVWRKQTEKAIALFERERLDREKSNGFDEAAFKEAVDHFNSGVQGRREERDRLLNEARAVHQNRQSHASRRQLSIAESMSLDHGHESETESVMDAREQGHYDSDVRLSRADIHATETAKQSPESATPVHTPKSHPPPLQTEQLSTSQPNSQPTSQPTSRPDSPSVFEGSTYAPLSDDGRLSDLDLRGSLDFILANQIQWSEEEENYRYVPCLTLNQARDAFRDTVLGLEYLHYQGIMHRDIKPANLLWTSDYRVKISDFGVSYLGKPIREDDHKEGASDKDTSLDEDIELAKTVGTPAFYAPELCDPDFFDTEKHSERPQITGQIDVWALGVTLYGMIFGCLPFFHPNEFQMYEKIARDEVFIPHLRLKGVEHTFDTPSSHNKRLDDILEYEDVDDSLRDLIERLLAKKPSQRITLKDVKRHPWVIKGIDDMDSWLEHTDPSRYSQGEIIKPSEEEIKDAVVGLLPMFDRFKTNVNTGLQRLSSVFRGRGSRKRTDSNPKVFESAGSASSSRTKDDRRSSLRGDEIFSALKASRDTSEHPLAHSVAASPEYKIDHQYFPEQGPGFAESHSSNQISATDHALSTADSVKTIRPHAGSHVREALHPSVMSAHEDLSSPTTLAEPSSNASGLGSIIGAPVRLMSSMRRGSPSQSSRSSSVEAHREELHAHPSLAVSSALAAGHVDQPPALRDDVDQPRPSTSSTDAFQRAQEHTWRRSVPEIPRPSVHRRSISVQAAEIACPPSPEEDLFFGHARPASAADSSSGFPAISSSSDMLVSGESAAHSRIPSVVSGASSLSAAPEEGDLNDLQSLGKEAGAPMFGEQRSPARITAQRGTSGEMPPTSFPKAAAGDEAGYNGEPEDSDSEDEGLAMA